ncbi:MAG TPA: electron transporter RnfG [Firmicutes bacterium]|nr:electron transporter RnfG [Bacillota bacterium]
MMKNETFRLGLVLMVFTGAAALLLAGFNLITVPVIEAQQVEAELAAQQAVLPIASSFVDGQENMAVDLADYPALEAVSVGLAESGEPVGLVMRLAPKGYGGPIKLMVGIDQEGKIVGLQVLAHQESPGLGANISKESFTSQFIGKDANAPLRVVKGTTTAEHDIVALTSATISSQAVAEGINQALQLFCAGWGK